MSDKTKANMAAAEIIGIPDSIAVGLIIFGAAFITSGAVVLYHALEEH